MEYKYVEVFTNNKESGNCVIVQVNGETIVSTCLLTPDHLGSIFGVLNGDMIVHFQQVDLTDKELENI